MNLFQAMGARSKSNAIQSDNMPIVNDFVDVAAGGVTDTVCIENVAKFEFETRRPSKVDVGSAALFNYRTKTGRFRFRTECIKIDGQRATFAVPSEITIIEKFDEKRQSFRLKKMIDVQWRYAPGGVGNGPLVRGKLMDLSARGACLDVGRELKKATLVELTFGQIICDGTPLVVIAELTRPAARDVKGIISAGVKFKELGLTRENAVSEFIGRYEKDDKTRHLAR